MQLSQLSDTVQELCHEGHSLSRVHFGIDDVEYILKSIDVTPTTVTFKLQMATQKETVTDGFLGIRNG